MSSHYIFLSCYVEGCDKQETLYTGNLDSYEFNNSAWEGETLEVPCKAHDWNAV